MLSREQWTKPSLDDFIVWLKTKPRRETYAWFSADICPCGQYGEYIGVKWVGQVDSPLWATLNSLALVRPHTFGALLRRTLAFRAAGGKL
jgi:hypothetical protein